MKNKICNKEFVLKIVMFFLIIQPLLDIYILFDERIVNMFGFSPSTIIRIFFVFFLGILFLIVFKLSKKYLIYVAYIFLIIVYVIFHHINALNFNSLVPGNFNYNIISELFYIIRMLIPLFMIFISYHVKFNDKNLNKTIIWLVLLISGSIVVTNLLGISLGSYTNEIIGGNIITWFTNGYDNFSFYSLASKSFFYFANSIAALLCLLSPILFYLYIIKGSKFTFFLLVIQLLAMFMLGTKVSTFGFICVSFLTIFIYLFFTLIKKDLVFKLKTSLSLCLIFIFCILLLPYSPAINRIDINESHFEETKENINKKNDEKNKMIDFQKEIILNSNKIDNRTDLSFLDGDLENLYIAQENTYIVNREVINNILIPFINKNYQLFSINKNFIEEAYPYQYDPIFWYEIMKQPLANRIDNRLIEQQILDRVIKINGNKYDKLFGISYIRMGNIYNIERDFISHYYTLGIIGLILLLMPYVVITVVCGIIIIFKFKNLLTLRNTMFIFGIGLTLFVSFYSGNVMDALIVTIILGFVIGQLLNNVLKKESVFNETISIIMPTYNDCETICETLDSIKDQTYNNWELVIIDDGSTDNTKQIVSEYIKKNKFQDQIKYYYQKNQDQLNAVINGSQYINGDFILILHSDDLLAEKNTFYEAINYFNFNDCDAIFGDLKIIDGAGKNRGIQTVNDYKIKNKILPLQLLWLGRNLYVDTAMFRKNIFFSDVKENYLIWNTPFWISFCPKPKMLNVHKVNFSLIKYRVFEGNYINNEIGKLNVINGELRLATSLMKYYNIPKYKTQYKLFRAFNKIHLLSIFHFLYQKKETVDKYSIINFILEKRFNDDYNKYPYLEALNNFYKNYQNRTIKLELTNYEVYYGKDMRAFNIKMINDELDNTYKFLFKEMNKGFDTIKINKTKVEDLKTILKFLSINNDVKIVIEE